jgi:hypothetical protein
MANKPLDPKVTAYVIGGSAIAILLGVLTNSWLSAGGEVGVGPRGVCYQGTCSWEIVRKGDIEAIGYLTLIAGIACAGICGWVAWLTFANTPNKFPKFKLVNGVLGVGAFASTFFIIRLLIESNKEMSISYSPVFAIGGVITAGVFIRKLKAYWPGEGTTPWPTPVRAPQQAGWQGGAPMGSAPMGPPPGAPPMGPPPSAFGAPPSAPPFGGPGSGPPHSSSSPFGAPNTGAPPPHGSPAFGAPPNASPFGAPPPVGAPNAAKPDQYAATVISNPAAAAASSAPAANNKTILGAAAPQLRELLKQPPGGQPQQPPAGQPQASSNAAGGSHTQGGAQPQSKFCGRCGKPMQFVAQYQRWFCQGCQQYA